MPQNAESCREHGKTGMCMILSPVTLPVITFKLHCPIYSMNPAGNYMSKVNNENTRIKCEICSKLIKKRPERRQWLRSGIFIVNSEHISHLLVFI